jgi:hypothetical protein
VFFSTPTDKKIVPQKHPFVKIFRQNEPHGRFRYTMLVLEQHCICLKNIVRSFCGMVTASRHKKKTILPPKVFEGFQGTFWEKSPEWGLGQRPNIHQRIRPPLRFGGGLC